MKGKLIKDYEGWWVQHKAKGLDGNLEYIAESMLHPDDVKQIEEDAKVFDNIEARIAAYPNVEFEMVTEVVASVGNSEEQDEYTVSYAKLIPSKEQQKQLITEIMDLDAKDGLYEDEVSPTYTGEYPFPSKDRYDTVNDIEKLAEQYVNTNYPEYTNPKEKAAAIEDVCWGYNKAKETLYTEEQVNQKMIDFAEWCRTQYKLNGETFLIEQLFSEYKSLKQPKKD
jgi:hypothetical protein